MHTGRIASVVLAVFFYALPCIAAEPAPAERETSFAVPELTEFHNVIARIWHEAWPAKDTALLAQLAPEVEKGAEKVGQAELPGILRDHKAAWQQNVKTLQVTTAAYVAAAKAKDDQKLLAAAEAIHGDFERLVRTIRPPLRELAAFHVVLYRVYHHEQPGRDTAKVRASAAEMRDRVKDLQSAKLPPRLEARQAAFETGRAALAAAVADLNAKAATATSAETLDAPVERVHDAYRALETALD